MSLRRTRFTLLAMLALAGPALGAPVPTFELERLRLNPGSTQTLTLDTGDALPAQTLRASLVAHLEHNPLLFTVDQARVGAVISNRVTAHLLAAYAFTDWAEVSLALPVVLYQAGDDLSALGISPVTPTALGAGWVAGRFTLLREAAAKPFDLSLSVALGVPLGSPSALTRDPGTGLAFSPRIGAGRTLGPLRLGAELGAVVRGSQVLSPLSSVVGDEIGSLFAWGLAVNTVTLPVQLELAVRSEVPFTRAPVTAEVLLGARYRLVESLEIAALFGPGLGHSPGTPAFRVLLGLSWVPSFKTRARPASTQVTP